MEKTQKRALVKSQSYMVSLAFYSQVSGEQPDVNNIVYEEIDGALCPCVEVVGEEWATHWRNGKRGIWLVKDETSSSVRKTAHMDDTSLQLQGADKVFDRLRSTVFGIGGKHQPALATSKMDSLLNEAATFANTHQATVPTPAKVPTPARASTSGSTVHTSMTEDEEGPCHGVFGLSSFMVRQPAPKAPATKDPKSKREAKPKEARQPKKPTTRKRKQEGDCEEPIVIKRPWINLEPADTPSQDAQMPSSITNADKKWYDDLVDQIKSKLVMNLPAEDCEGSDMKAAIDVIQKNIGTLLQEVRIFS